MKMTKLIAFTAALLSVSVGFSSDVAFLGEYTDGGDYTTNKKLSWSLLQMKPLAGQHIKYTCGEGAAYLDVPELDADGNLDGVVKLTLNNATITNSSDQNAIFLGTGYQAEIKLVGENTITAPSKTAISLCDDTTITGDGSLAIRDASIGIFGGTGSSLTIESGAIDISSAYSSGKGISINYGVKYTQNGGTVNIDMTGSLAYGFFGSSASGTSPSSKFILNGGELTVIDAKRTAMNLSDAEINGGTLTAKHSQYASTAVVSASTRFVVTGGNIVVSKPDKNGNDVVSAANLSVTGAKISGGSFNFEPTATWIETGYQLKSLEDGSYWVAPKNTQAVIGTTEYDTLAEAFAAASVNQTIKLSKALTINEELTTVAAFDLNERTLTGGTISAKSITNGALIGTTIGGETEILGGTFTDVTLGSDVVVKGGTFNSDVSANCAAGLTAFPNGGGTYSALPIVAKIGETCFKSFEDAVESITDETMTTITLVADSSLKTVPYNITNKNLTLDLNGNALTHTEDGGQRMIYFTADNGNEHTIVVKDSSEAKTGRIEKIITNSISFGMAYTIVADKGSTLKLESGTLKSSGSGVWLDNAKFEMTGGRIDGGTSNGLMIQGGIAEKKVVESVISGGEITGKIGIKTGSYIDLLIKGDAVITGTVSNDDSGSIVAGYDNHIAITSGSVVVNGNIKGVAAREGQTDGSVIELSAGTYNNITNLEMLEGYILPGYLAWEVGENSYVVSHPVAKIDTVEYATLQDAISAAESGAVIAIVGDVSSEKVAIENKVIYISGAINGRNVDCECEVPMKNGDMLFGDLEMAVAEVTSRGYSPFVVNKSVLFKMHKGVTIESDIVLPPYANTNSAIYFDAEYCGKAEQTLDLNGHTISQKQGGPGGYWWSSVHVNCATVRIVDTSEAQTGKITGIGSCITITGYDEYQGYSFPAQVTLESGTLTVTGKPQKSGSNTYYAENGIVGIFYSGKFIMTGGKIDAVTDLDPEGKVAGVIADGANTTYGKPSVTITGGEIIGVPLDHLIERKPGIPLSTDGIFAGAIVSEDMIKISGGTFSSPINLENCADDYYPTVVNGGYGVCTDPVANIGGLYFRTYAEAVAVAKAAITSAADKNAMIDAIVANTIVAIKAPTEKIVVDNDVAIFFDFSADTYYAANNANATKRDALYKKYFDVQCAMSFGYNSSVNPRPSVTLVGGGEAILDAMIDTEKRVNKHAKANYYHMIYTYKNIKFTKDWETPVYGNIGIVFSTRAGTEASPIVVDLNGHTLLQGKAIGNPSGMRIWQADAGYTKMIDSTANESNDFIGNGWLIGDQNTIAVQNGATFVLDSGNISHRGSYYKKPLKDSKGVVYDYELDAHIVAAVLGGKFIMNGGRLTWKRMDDPSTGILAEHVNVYQANAIINGGTIDVIPSDICNRAEKYYWEDMDGSGELYPYGPYKTISGLSVYWYAEAGVAYGNGIKFVNQVARVGNTYYEDIDAAFAAAYASVDKEITLLHSVDYDEDGNVAGTYDYDAEIVLAASVEKFTVETTYMYYDAKVTNEVSTKGVIGRPRYETKKDTILKHDFDYDWVDYTTCEQIVVDMKHKDTEATLSAPINIESSTINAKKGLVESLTDKDVAEMTQIEKKQILEAEDCNGLKVWENALLGLDGAEHFDVTAEMVDSRYGHIVDLTVPKGEFVNTGFTVDYQVMYRHPVRQPNPVRHDYGSTIYFEQSGIDPTGIYEVQAIIKSVDPNMKPIAVNTQNKIGVVKATQEMELAIIAVPWKHLENVEADITVDDLVHKEMLDVDDTIYVYKTDGGYNSWTLEKNTEGNKVWGAMQVVDARGARTSGHAGDHTVQRGAGVFLKRQDPSKPYILYGQYSDEEVVTELDEPMNLVANPNIVEFDLNAEGAIESQEGDNIVIPTVGAPKICEKDADGWFYVDWVKGDKGIMQMNKVRTVTIPAGTGFWYQKKNAEGNAKIHWSK